MLTIFILALSCRSACGRSRAHEISLDQTSRPNGGSARTSGNSKTRRSNEVSLGKSLLSAVPRIVLVLNSPSSFARSIGWQ